MRVGGDKGTRVLLNGQHRTTGDDGGYALWCAANQFIGPSGIFSLEYTTHSGGWMCQSEWTAKRETCAGWPGGWCGQIDVRRWILFLRALGESKVAQVQWIKYSEYLNNQIHRQVQRVKCLRTTVLMEWMRWDTKGRKCLCASNNNNKSTTALNIMGGRQQYSQAAAAAAGCVDFNACATDASTTTTTIRPRARSPSIYLHAICDYPQWTLVYPHTHLLRVHGNPENGMNGAK